MIPEDDARVPEDRLIQLLLAFDEALAAGRDVDESEEAWSPLHAVHQCQRLLEAVWPRRGNELPHLPGRFGRFLILRELGRGGFGLVFLATDTVLGRKVALKVPRPEVLITPDVRRRFLREAEAASRLDHPHIVPVYEVGEEGPVHYIASAYCEGITLAEWIRARQAPIAPRSAARTLAMLAGAVGHAHERGILHRDLKPGNILLTRPCVGSSSDFDEDIIDNHHPRICDFGLAKLLEQPSQETCSGVPIGSPNYMSPEQATGRSRDCGPATDIYALGVILYELLTGRPPFHGDTTLETLRQVAENELAPPRASRPDLPRDLETICLKGLQKRPDRRYASATELADDLERFIERRPIKARPVAAWERGWKWFRRRPAHAALAAVLVLTSLGAIVGLSWFHAREKQYTSTSREAFHRVRESAKKAHEQSLLATRHQRLALKHWVASQLKTAEEFYNRGEVETTRSILNSLRPEPGMPDCRGFAWHYLDRLCTIDSLAALPSKVSALSFSADGRSLALADDETRTFIMDRETGQLRALNGRHRFTGWQLLRFSADGRILASLCYELHRDSLWKSDVKLWDTESGEELTGMPEEFGLGYQLVFSRDGQTLFTLEAAGSHPDAPIRAWKLSADRRRVTLDASLSQDQLTASLPQVHTRRETSFPSEYDKPRAASFSDVLAISPDGSTLAVFLENGEIRLYTTVGGYCKAVCWARGTEVVFVPRTDLLNPDSDVAIETIAREACLLTGCDKARPICPERPILSAEFSPDGRTLAALQPVAGKPLGVLHRIDVDSGQIQAAFAGENVSNGAQFRFSPAGEALVITAFDSNARRWNLPARLRGHNQEVWGLAFAPGGRTLASASDDHTIKLWDVATGRERKPLKGHGSLVTAVVYSPDGKLIASAGYDQTVRLWEAASGRSLAVLRGHTHHIRTLAFAPDGMVLASAGIDQTVRLWDVAARRALSPPMTGHTNQVYSLAFSPDGRTLVSGGDDGTIRLWDWRAGRSREVWQLSDAVLSLTVSPDGQTIAAAHRHGNIHLMDVATGKARFSLRGHSREVLGVAFSPDGLTLASAGEDKTVRLWEPATGQELLTLKGHENQVHPLAFSPDGAILASGCYDGKIMLWRAGGVERVPAQEE
jgi:WD40 repeat protein